MRFFVTGTAGFVGFHMARRLLDDGHEVMGYDGVTDYYDQSLKRARTSILEESIRFQAVEAMLEDRTALEDSMIHFAPHVVLHFAAQAGVRYSLSHPDEYIASNIVGTKNVLEAARAVTPKHLLFASTSSIYGGNVQMPFRETDRTDAPMSLYAATKKACEALTHSFSHLYGIPSTCLRFFTVYGPWGRPDMALYKFTQAISSASVIDVYGYGRLSRDFTYIDDLVEAVSRLIGSPPECGAPISIEDSLSPVAPFRTVNIGGGQPVELMEYILAIEAALGREARKNFLPAQPGDVTATHADTALLHQLTGFRPKIPVTVGVSQFVQWYESYYGLRVT